MRMHVLAPFMETLSWHLILQVVFHWNVSEVVHPYHELHVLVVVNKDNE